MVKIKTRKIGKNSKIVVDGKKITLSSNSNIGKVKISSDGKVSLNIKMPFENVVLKKNITLYK